MYRGKRPSWVQPGDRSFASDGRTTVNYCDVIDPPPGGECSSYNARAAIDSACDDGGAGFIPITDNGTGESVCLPRYGEGSAGSSS